MYSSVRIIGTNEKTYLLFSFRAIYRPHPKDGEGNVFSLFTTVVGRGGDAAPVPGSFPDHWSQILSREYPSPRFFSRSVIPGLSRGGTPVPGSFSGHWSQVLSRGYPSPRFFPRETGPRSFPGGTQVPGSFPGHWSQVLSRGYLVLAGGTPSWGTPSQVRMRYPPQDYSIHPARSG